MKTIDVYLSEKGISKDVFEGYSAEEKAAFIEAIGTVVNLKRIDKTGYRTIVNNGEDSMQEVPHLHVHVLGGRRLGALLPS